MKRIAVRVSFAFLLALTLLLAGPINAQTTYFKIGDSVEAMGPDGKWASAVVLEACDRENGCYGYTVVQGSDRWFVKSAYIRGHTMTPAEQAEADKTAAELAARASSGNGIGAEYGVREPTTCRSRTALPDNPATAKQYVLCDAEGFDGVENVNLLSDVNVQVAPARPRTTAPCTTSPRRLDHVTGILSETGTAPLPAAGWHRQALRTKWLQDNPPRAWRVLRPSRSGDNTLMIGNSASEGIYER